MKIKILLSLFAFGTAQLYAQNGNPASLKSKKNTTALTRNVTIVDCAEEEKIILPAKFERNEKLVLINAKANELKSAFQNGSPIQTICNIELVNCELNGIDQEKWFLKADTMEINGSMNDNAALQNKFKANEHLHLEAMPEEICSHALKHSELPPSVSIVNIESDHLSGIYTSLQNKKIESLSLQNNSITNFPDALLQMKELKKLSLGGNEISAIDTNAIGNKFSFLDLDGNPVMKNKNIQQWIDGINLGTSRKKNDSNYISLAENRKYFNSPHPHLKPALENINVKPQIFTIPEQDQSELVLASGGTIKIPGNAFVDKNGSPVSGKIDFVVKEYNDPLDIIIAGIPMQEKSGDNSVTLVSDGMFEMNAYANGEELQLKEDKAIEVNYPNKGNTVSPSFFRLDEKTGDWTTLADSLQPNESVNLTREVTRSKPLQFTPAQKYYNALQRTQNNIKDTTSYSTRFNDKWHVHDILMDSALVNDESTFTQQYYKTGNATRFRLQRIETGNEIIRFKFTHGDKKNYNEQKVYNPLFRMEWQLTEELTEKEARKFFSDYKHFCDIQILKSDSVFIFKIKGVNGITQINATPVTARKNTRSTLRNYETKYKRFMVSKSRYESKNPPQTDMHLSTRYGNLKDRKKWKLARKLMNKEEKKMTYKNWKNSYEAKRTIMNAPIGTDDLRNLFVLNQMGMYNIDCRSKLNNPIDIIVQHPESSQVQSAYLLQPGSNRVINFYGDKAFVERGKQSILFSTGNGKIMATKISPNEKFRPNEIVITEVAIDTDKLSLRKIYEALDELTLTVYPNPNNGKFKIKLSEEVRGEIQVLGMDGKLTWNGEINGMNADIDISAQLPGNYIVQIIKNGKLVCSSRVIKS